MRLSFLAAFLLTSLTFALPSDHDTFHPSHYIDLSTASIPTIREAALQARQLILSSSISTLSTVFPSHEHSGAPFGLMDYYTDCSTSGNPTLLVFPLATTFRNALSSNATLSFSVHSSQPRLSRPRLSLLGKLMRWTNEDKECYVRRHPDATLWTPGNRIHKSYWMRLEVESLYWVGGFGNVAYIGWIPAETYANISLSEVQAAIRKEERNNGKNGGGDGWWRRLFYQGL